MNLAYGSVMFFVGALFQVLYEFYTTPQFMKIVTPSRIDELVTCRPVKMELWRETLLCSNGGKIQHLHNLKEFKMIIKNAVNSKRDIRMKLVEKVYIDQGKLVNRIFIDNIELL